ncbi:TPA: rhamnosyltransferase [Enterobacter hormaechei]|nr:rhamnosyltransferase [Enterobacter hormaechei]HEM8124102.1 rhamnosyltransferase [Enterobacter hormaechei]
MDLMVNLNKYLSMFPLLRFYAVVVTYNPDVKKVIELVTILQKYKVTVVIVDNTPGLNNYPFQCHLIKLGDNFGIATAQNHGIEYCLKDGADAIWFYDQDSVITDDFVQEFLTTVAGNPEDKIFAPVFWDEKKGFEYAITDIDSNGNRKKLLSSSYTDDFYSSVVISSGSLIKTELLLKIGLMLDSLFIDYVDTEWCLRAYYNGYKVHIIKNARMEHSIGDNTISLLGFNVPIHSPMRRYYRIRNSFLLFRMKHIPKKLALREIVFSCCHQIIIILTQKNKIEYLKYFLDALIDGLGNKAGKNIK